MHHGYTLCVLIQSLTYRTNTHLLPTVGCDTTQREYLVRNDRAGVCPRASEKFNRVVYEVWAQEAVAAASRDDIDADGICPGDEDTIWDGEIVQLI